MNKLWKSKWFILIALVCLFVMATSARVVMAGTDAQLTQILDSGLKALKAYFDWLLQVLAAIW